MRGPLYWLAATDVGSQRGPGEPVHTRVPLWKQAEILRLELESELSRTEIAKRLVVARADVEELLWDADDLEGRLRILLEQIQPRLPGVEAPQHDNRRQLGVPLRAAHRGPEGRSR
jgi:hypothetical protein